MLQPRSYDSAAQTLYIPGDTVGTYAVDSKTLVRAGEQTLTLDDLNRRWVVVATRDQVIKGVKHITSIDVRPVRRNIDTPEVRRLLLGVVLVELAAILLIITNAAASTVTREKEDGTLEMLLTTPITSRFYIWGKLSGLVGYVAPLLAVPVVSCAIFVAYDLLRWMTDGGASEWIVLPEALLILPAQLVMVCALASLVGMQMSLTLRTTVMAVIVSVAIVLGAVAGLGWCGFSLVQNSASPPTLAISAFSPTAVLALMIAPGEVLARKGLLPATLDAQQRGVIFAFALAAAVAYAAVVFGLYKSMVKNFDMTIRRQSR